MQRRSPTREDGQQLWNTLQKISASLPEDHLLCAVKRLD
jgi:hypothetical protein